MTSRSRSRVSRSLALASAVLAISALAAAQPNEGVAGEGTPIRVPAAASPDLATQPGSYLGVETASNDNVLEDANAYLGISVTRVVENSPAQALGIQVGDILLEANEIELDAPERLDDVLAALPAGAVLRLRVERAARVEQLETRTVPRLVVAQPESDSPSEAESPLRVERRHLGFEFRSASPARLGELGQSPSFGIEVLKLAPRSPLRPLGVGVGDVITEIDGRAIPSPDDVVQFFSELSGVSEVRLTIWSGSGEQRRLVVPLYRPDRKLTNLQIPALLSLQRGKDTSEYSFVLGAVRLTRLANGSRIRILWWFQIETGSPDELIDMGKEG